MTRKLVVFSFYQSRSLALQPNLDTRRHRKFKHGYRNRTIETPPERFFLYFDATTCDTHQDCYFFWSIPFSNRTREALPESFHPYLYATAYNANAGCFFFLSISFSSSTIKSRSGKASKNLGAGIGIEPGKLYLNAFFRTSTPLHMTRDSWLLFL